MSKGTEPTITLALSVARRLFDLATDSPLMCSGSFESDDVKVLRALAGKIGVDPLIATPDEFVRDYPHPFKARELREWFFDAQMVHYWVTPNGTPIDVSDEDAKRQGRRRMHRFETPTEQTARIAEARADVTCYAGEYARRCGRLAEADIHV